MSYDHTALLCECGYYYMPPVCTKCGRVQVGANTTIQGFGSSRCSPEGPATTAMCSEAEIAALRRRLLDESGITQDGIAKAIRGLKRCGTDIAHYGSTTSWSRMAEAIDQLELIAAWFDAAK